MQVLQPEQLWTPLYSNFLRYTLTSFTGGREINFTVATNKHGSKVKLSCFFENNDGVSGFIPFILFLTLTY